VSIGGVSGCALTERFSRLPLVRKAVVAKETLEETWVRLYPRSNGNGNHNAELVRHVLEAANGWPVLDLRTEEGRLDDVFRSITLPETVKSGECRETVECQVSSVEGGKSDVLPPAIRHSTGDRQCPPRPLTPDT
jgi:hypothetical protein